MSYSRASSKRTGSLSGPQAEATRPKPRPTASSNQGLPLPMKRWVRALFGKRSRKKQTGGPDISRKALWAGGSVATLALLAIVPSRGTSQAIANATCQQVIKSGAEISRSQLSSLLSIPAGASPEAVRQAISEPYCLLPVPHKKQNSEKQDSKAIPAEVTTREAYPLAFDPQAWVVVNYSSGAYIDYDFVFKR